MPAEPRKEVPFEWILGAAAAVDLTNFREVQAMLLMLMLLFTFSRSETPLPESHTGRNCFDKLKHLQVADVRMIVHEGVKAIGFRLKGIKQDPRMQRPAAQGDGDWVYVGELDGPLNIVLWLQRFVLLLPSGDRDDASPFFRANQSSPDALLYRTGLEDVRRLWAKVDGVSKELAKTCGLHGLRVRGNNSARNGKGREFSVVQGGWAHEGTQGRYDRFDLVDILDLPRAMVASWKDRDADFDFDGIQVPPANESSVSTSTPQAPPRSAPVERAVASPGANRNVRLQTRQLLFSPAPAIQAVQVRSPAAAGRQRRAPEPPRLRRPAPAVVQNPPALVAPRQHRDPSSRIPALSRPVRSLGAPDRLQATLPGNWSSAGPT